MKKCLLALVISVSSFSVMASSDMRSGGSTAGSVNYQVCHVDGNAIMLQPNMCYAIGGRLTK